MTLLDHIGGMRPDNVALVGGWGRQDYGDLAARAGALRERLSPTGLRVFLNLSDLSEALVALAALDGIVDAVVLSSPSLDEATLCTLAGVSADAIITDRTDLHGSDLPVLRDPAELAGLRSAPETCSTRWIMTTSGTTGRPKLVEHSLESLSRTTRKDRARGTGQVWGLLYDYTRFAGLQVVLQSLLSGARLVVPEADSPLDDRLALLSAEGCTHLSATPTLWRKILMSRAVDGLALRQVTLGGEIADDAVLRALARSFPEARISHIFASTEAGVGFSVTDGKAGFPESYLTDPPQGISLKVEDGRLFVHNDRVGPAYVGGGDIACDGWVDTGDLVARRGGRIVFLGRGSGVINVGGDKVVPEEVETVLLTHPEVHMARVYAKTNPIMGALVAADVHPEPGSDPTQLRASLRDWCAARLDRHKVPAVFRMVDQFRTNAAGKIERSN
ncbi:acyl-CoA synthetase (AMP-forming)/AMP-acid ligase II [Rhodovulum imhoffii]|uniref:Long-chain-fatty-acid--CoA ligase n=1 Tax=Rhodovulum imhoffii TaxID=365340 RepID=A0A2T5BTZ0_9RHOB|nr:fatty acid--CoA ligase family protein [Rhodovulum imhoffii]MBK5932734.1 hypothetical protein [Rhodovulum imhoffii]PTN02940.1 acyl-CoA synthetase (AMP-forming)/AMP-acid ligase II [Rhodovulum imhoffii]